METVELTNDLLKEKMVDVVCDRTPTGVISDANLCVQAGAYRTGPSTKNAPTTNWGILEVTVGGDIKKQEWTALSANTRYFYRTTNANSFTDVPWVEVSRVIT